MHLANKNKNERPSSCEAELAAAGVRVTLDDRDERPGWKFAES
jgi:hypothetical protein